MAACAGPPLLKEHWLPHTLTHILQKEKLSGFYNGAATMKTKPASSLEKTSVAEKLSNDSSEGDNNKEQVTRIIYPLFYLALMDTWKMFSLFWRHGVVIEAHLFRLFGFVWITGSTRSVLWQSHIVLYSGELQPCEICMCPPVCYLRCIHKKYVTDCKAPVNHISDSEWFSLYCISDCRGVFLKSNCF